MVYGEAPAIGDRVTAGTFCWSFTVDSGYKPLAGLTVRRFGSVDGCCKPGAFG
jgi:hypothetical protein